MQFWDMMAFVEPWTFRELQDVKQIPFAAGAVGSGIDFLIPPAVFPAKARGHR